MTQYRVTATVKEIRGTCPLYNLGDKIVFEGFYVKPDESKTYVYRFVAMSTLLSAFTHGTPAEDLGIGSESNIGYVQRSGFKEIDRLSRTRSG